MRLGVRAARRRGGHAEQALEAALRLARPAFAGLPRTLVRLQHSVVASKRVVTAGLASTLPAVCPRATPPLISGEATRPVVADPRVRALHAAGAADAVPTGVLCDVRLRVASTASVRTGRSDARVAVAFDVEVLPGGHTSVPRRLDVGLVVAAAPIRQVGRQAVLRPLGDGVRLPPRAPVGVARVACVIAALAVA